jgi:hypothetical protein
VHAPLLYKNKKIPSSYTLNNNILNTQINMKVNLFFLVVGVSWLSKSLVKGTKGARLYKKRLLETTSENTSGSAKGISSAKKGNYNYGSSDFEYVATLSSKVSKKSSNKETSEDGSGSGGGKRSSKKSKGSSDVSIDNDGMFV